MRLEKQNVLAHKWLDTIRIVARRMRNGIKHDAKKTRSNRDY